MNDKTLNVWFWNQYIWLWISYFLWNQINFYITLLAETHRGSDLFCPWVWKVYGSDSAVEWVGPIHAPHNEQYSSHLSSHWISPSWYFQVSPEFLRGGNWHRHFIISIHPRIIFKAVSLYTIINKSIRRQSFGRVMMILIFIIYWMVSAGNNGLIKVINKLIHMKRTTKLVLKNSRCRSKRHARVQWARWWAWLEFGLIYWWPCLQV